MFKAALIGATGRMGTSIARACAMDDALLRIVTTVASAGSKSLGRDLGEIAGVRPLGVNVLGELPPDLGGAEVAIDFSRPELSLRALDVCRAAHVPVVIGTKRMVNRARQIAVDQVTVQIHRHRRGRMPQHPLDDLGTPRR